MLLEEYELQSVVIEVDHTHERFRLAIDLTAEQLYASTDLDLGRRQLDRLQKEEDEESGEPEHPP